MPRRKLTARPRRLFKTRVRGDALHVGPQFVGGRPNYEPLVDALVAEVGPTLERGKVHRVGIYHDDWCPALAGGCCNCDPEVKLLESAP